MYISFFLTGRFQRKYSLFLELPNPFSVVILRQLAINPGFEEHSGIPGSRIGRAFCCKTLEYSLQYIYIAVNGTHRGVEFLRQVLNAISGVVGQHFHRAQQPRYLGLVHLTALALNASNPYLSRNRQRPCCDRHSRSCIPAGSVGKSPALNGRRCRHCCRTLSSHRWPWL